MARSKQTARKSTGVLHGGRAPRKQLATKAARNFNGCGQAGHNIRTCSGGGGGGGAYGGYDGGGGRTPAHQTLAAGNMWVVTPLLIVLTFNVVDGDRVCQWRSSNTNVKYGGYGSICCAGVAGGGCADACLEPGCVPGNRFCDVRFTGNKCRDKKDYCQNIYPDSIWKWTRKGKQDTRSHIGYVYDFPRAVHSDVNSRAEDGGGGYTPPMITAPCTVDSVTYGKCFSNWGATGDIPEYKLDPSRSIAINVMSYTCHCNDGYSGADCEIDSCGDPMACGGHGICNRGSPHYTCTCNTGWLGDHCDQKADYCPKLACDGHGTCSSDSAKQTYTCTCDAAAGWTGKHCDQKADYCPKLACDGHGTCSSDWATQTYTCTCDAAAGWTGKHCDHKHQGIAIGLSLSLGLGALIASVITILGIRKIRVRRTRAILGVSDYNGDDKLLIDTGTIVQTKLTEVEGAKTEAAALLASLETDREDLVQRAGSVENARAQVQLEQNRVAAELVTGNARVAEEKQRLNVRLAANLAEVAAKERRIALDQSELAEKEHQIRAKIADVLAIGQELAKKMFECSMCLDDVERIDGFKCNNPGADDHFVCEECLTKHVTKQMDMSEGLGMIEERKGCVICPGFECKSGPLLDEDVMRYAKCAWEIYQTAKFKLLEKKVQQTAVAGERMRAKEEQERLEKMSADERRLLGFKKHITESILNLACPRCKAAFLDFDGCFSLTCRNCPCSFCAMCLEDCGGDAHKHAARCQEGQGLKGAGYFGSQDSFIAIQKRRRERLVKEYIQTQVPVGDRGMVVQRCERELADIGILQAVSRDFPPPAPAAAAHGGGGGRRVLPRLPADGGGPAAAAGGGGDDAALAQQLQEEEWAAN